VRFFILCKLFSLVIYNITHFYLCDAMLAYGRVAVSVTNRYSVETVERFGLVLAWELLSTYHTPCFKEIDVHIPSKIRVLLGNFAPNSGLRKFCHSISIIEACYQLSSRKVDAHSVINWSVVDQLS